MEELTNNINWLAVSIGPALPICWGGYDIRQSYLNQGEWLGQESIFMKGVSCRQWP